MSLRYYMSSVHGHFQRDVKMCLKRTQNIVQNHNVFKEQYRPVWNWEEVIPL